MYLLIVYKPDSIDYCMGNVMEHYSSDFSIYEYPDEESLIQQMAAIISRNNFTEQGDADFRLIVVKGELVIDEVETNFGLDSELWERARSIADSLTAERREKEQRDKQKEGQRNKKEKEQQERKELVRLKQKYEVRNEKDENG